MVRLYIYSTVARVVPCGGCKNSPYIIIVQVIWGDHGVGEGRWVVHMQPRKLQC